MNQLYNAKNLIDLRLSARVHALKQYAIARTELQTYTQLQPEEQTAHQLIGLANEVGKRLEQLRVIDEAIETLELFIAQPD